MKSVRIFLLLLPCAVGLLQPLQPPNSNTDPSDNTRRIDLLEKMFSALQLQTQSDAHANAIRFTVMMKELSEVKGHLKASETEVVRLKLQLAANVQEISFNQTKMDADINTAVAVVNVMKNDISLLAKKVSINNIATSRLDIILNATEAKVNTSINEQKIRMVQQNQSLSSNLESIRTNVHSLQRDVTELGGIVNMTSTSVSSFNSSLLDLFTRTSLSEVQLETFRSDLMKNVTERLSSDHALVEHKHDDVAFEARFSGYSGKAGTHIKYNHVMFNVGSGYEISSGIFTAPVAGVYTIWISATKPAREHDDSILISIMKGDTMVGTVKSYRTHSPTTTVLVVYLKRTEGIWCRTPRSVRRYVASFGAVLLHAR